MPRRATHVGFEADGPGERYDVGLRIRPVLPMVMRGLAVPRIKRLNIVLDTAREARRLVIPFANMTDPLGPGIARCLAIWPIADQAGRGREFVRSAPRGAWSEALDAADDDDLRTMVERAGLDWASVQPALDDARRPGGAWEQRAAAERQRLLDGGLWGVPSYRVGPYALWGQDRLWMVEDLLARAVELTRLVSGASTGPQP